MATRIDESGNDDLVETHEINVTPFIDVMLVLLIIFMVAAPLATVDVPVDLPTSNAAPQKRPDKPIFLSVRADMSLMLGSDRITREELQSRLTAVTNGDREQRIFLRADRAIPYGDVMEVMNQVRDAGYSKIGLVHLEVTGSAPAAN